MLGVVIEYEFTTSQHDSNMPYRITYQRVYDDKGHLEYLATRVVLLKYTSGAESTGMV